MYANTEIIGHLGKAPEVKYTKSGMAVCKFTVATSRYSKNQKEEVTTWYTVTLFGTSAQNAEKYLQKGSKVFISGYIQTFSWEKEGQTHYGWELVGNNVIYLSPKKGASSDDGYGGTLSYSDEERYQREEEERYQREEGERYEREREEARRRTEEQFARDIPF